MHFSGCDDVGEKVALLQEIFGSSQEHLQTVLRKHNFDFDAAVEDLSQVDDSASVDTLWDMFPECNRQHIMDVLRIHKMNQEAALEQLLAESTEMPSRASLHSESCPPGDERRASQSSNATGGEDEEEMSELLGLLLARNSEPHSSKPGKLKTEPKVRGKDWIGYQVPTQQAISPENRALTDPQVTQSLDTRQQNIQNHVHVHDANFDWQNPAGDDGFTTVRNKREERPAPPRSTSQRRMVLLVGLPGSGKSTLAKAFPRDSWGVVCQDQLGTRQACEERAAELLAAGRCVVVDRTNIDAAQRAIWLRIARAQRLPPSAVACVFLDVPFDECRRRILARRGHPTLPPDQGSIGVLKQFQAQLERPSESEGFAEIRVVAPDAAGTADLVRSLIG